LLFNVYNAELREATGSRYTKATPAVHQESETEEELNSRTARGQGVHAGNGETSLRCSKISATGISARINHYGSGVTRGTAPSDTLQEVTPYQNIFSWLNLVFFSKFSQKRSSFARGGD